MIDKIALVFIILIFIILLFDLPQRIAKKYDYYKVRYQLKRGRYYHRTYKFTRDVSDFIIQEHIKNSKKLFIEKYKLDVDHHISIGLESDDFVRDLKTLLITYNYDKK